MRISFLHSIVLFLGYSAVLNALALPPTGPQDVARQIETLDEHGTPGVLEVRSPRVRGGGRPPRSRPARPTTKPVPTSKPTPTKPAQTSVVNQPISTKRSTSITNLPTSTKSSTSNQPASSKLSTSSNPTLTNSGLTSITNRPTSTKHSSSSSIKSLPFTLPPRPTKAFDVCLLPEVSCLDARSEDSETLFGRSEQPHALEKRARELSDIPLKSGKLKVTPKDYPSSGQLEKGKASKWVETWVDFQSANLADTEAKLFKSKPPLPAGALQKDYVTEHILELQSMSRFIEAVTGTKSTNNPSPIQLSKTVDDTWFTKWWNKDVQAKINTRNPTFTGYENSKDARYQDKSLNDVVFEAFGSSRNVDDFVLCEDGINSFKAKLWLGDDPAAKWNDAATKAAKGLKPSDEYLSPLRTTLAVYSYMELPQITKNLHSSIAKVKTELGNIAHLTSNDLPKDAQGQPADLAALWIEFMDAHLAKFVNKGKTWLDSNIKTGLKQFEAELKIMEGWLKKIPNTPQSALTDKYNAAVKAEQAAQKELTSNEKKRKSAASDLAAEIKKIEAQFINDPNASSKIEAEKKKPGTAYKSAIVQLGSAKTRVTRSQTKVGQATRKILEFDEKNLKKEIANWKAVIAQLNKFEVERKKIKTLKAE
ncbi:uncharacterized protein CC84DRAFT_859040 [Paraphaeosphaeria sporulosa]|uniref:Uncharacterized protein n=1 Tax=Paraphaeosphaeria sporulosa TaxID=1460663 RepID=A0A177C9L4_9PLEO|nr:uncharacterized protein CC84DRAFT_859040 [Paraphaeosphaeria sporulosa]OAG03542.1 hypothetical protein CC84DRAFT_859040 [Paraphaeosphaeria sporulosa]